MPGGVYSFVTVGSDPSDMVPNPVLANSLLAASVAEPRHIYQTDPHNLHSRMNVSGKLYADIAHQRASTLGDNLINEHARRVRPSLCIAQYH